MNILKYFALSLLICPALVASDTKGAGAATSTNISAQQPGTGPAAGGAAGSPCHNDQEGDITFSQPVDKAKECLCKGAYNWVKRSKSHEAITVLGLIAGVYVAKKAYDKARAYYVAHNPKITCQASLDGKEVGSVTVGGKKTVDGGKE